MSMALGCTWCACVSRARQSYELAFLMKRQPAMQVFPFRKRSSAVRPRSSVLAILAPARRRPRMKSGRPFCAATWSGVRPSWSGWAQFGFAPSASSSSNVAVLPRATAPYRRLDRHSCRSTLVCSSGEGDGSRNRCGARVMDGVVSRSLRSSGFVKPKPCHTGLVAADFTDFFLSFLLVARSTNTIWDLDDDVQMMSLYALQPYTNYKTLNRHGEFMRTLSPEQLTCHQCSTPAATPQQAQFCHILRLRSLPPEATWRPSGLQSTA